MSNGGKWQSKWDRQQKVPPLNGLFEINDGRTNERMYESDGQQIMSNGHTNFSSHHEKKKVLWEKWKTKGSRKQIKIAWHVLHKERVRWKKSENVFSSKREKGMKIRRFERNWLAFFYYIDRTFFSLTFCCPRTSSVFSLMSLLSLASSSIFHKICKCWFLCVFSNTSLLPSNISNLTNRVFKNARKIE